MPASIWPALDTWGKSLKPWQRRALLLAVECGRLADEQVEDVYQAFLAENKLALATQAVLSGTGPVSGRPTTAAAATLHLERVGELAGVNALPAGAALTFSPGLTIIYGRNGSGKSGFARLFANACFSRHKPRILPNVYDAEAPRTASAKFHLKVAGQVQEPIEYRLGMDHPDLRRITVFDRVVADRHVSETTSFEFRPSGFDVFPELVRVYAAIGRKLDVAMADRTASNEFPKSFIGAETDASRVVAALSASSDLKSLRALGVFGDIEQARVADLDAQLLALKSASSKEVVEALKQARADLQTLKANMTQLASEFTSAKAVERAALIRTAKETTAEAALLGLDQFRRPFFRAIGTAEWDAFLRAAHTLGRVEGESYPSAEDRCLLCERPFDDGTRTHVEALFAYVEGDARKRATAASEAVAAKNRHVETLSVNLVPADSRVSSYLQKSDPTVATAVGSALSRLAQCRDHALHALRGMPAADAIIDAKPVTDALDQLGERIEADVKRLEQPDGQKAIEQLEDERRTLRHREVLSQLLPLVEKWISNAQWCEKARTAKRAITQRHITEKEKELFAAVVGDTYRQRLKAECAALDCALPIELQTVPRDGETRRSLSIKGGHKPQEILSEGEQRAIALADFLTEVGLNPASAGVILDDPVTSQDHERKQRIADRLVAEAKARQVVIFTHDLVFLNQVLRAADENAVSYQGHRIDRSREGRPGLIALGDTPSGSKVYDNPDKAKAALSEAEILSGTARDDAVIKGMGALRRTIEETIVKKLFQNVVPRWEDRVIVTALTRVKWDDALADELCRTFEELSAFIEGHSHTDEASGAPPEPKVLKEMIEQVTILIARARVQRGKSS